MFSSVIQSVTKNLEYIKWLLSRFFTSLPSVLNDNLILKNDSSSQHHIPSIEGCGLSRSNSGQWLMKLYMQGIVGQQSHGTTVGLLAITDFHDDIVFI